MQLPKIKIMNKIIKASKYFLIVYFLFGLTSLFGQDLNRYPIKNIKNPLIEQPGMSDPHMLVLNDTCYLFTGHDIGFGVSNWIMPDWRIFMSTDLQNWKHVGTISPKDNIMGEGEE